ncbi:MAG: prepilin-type N-terminal cleavage/methylation domain-containing protein [Syntrophorhabdaceae bacterium]|nr:prepilin-type N-terminal cleavage/methylation domain-containing protein [Syntrophorhabdaceae bacterium]
MATSKRYRFRSQGGLTLLEVLVATAIASIVLVSFLTLVLSSLDLEENARRLTEATMIADDKLKEIERGELPDPGVVEGLIDEKDPNGYAFRRTISETMIENVYLIEYEILWNKKRNSVSLITYMLKKGGEGTR